MSEDRRAVGDEDLMAYVDGECDEVRRRAVEAHIAASPAAAARIELWRRQRKILRAAFARVDAEPPPTSVLVPYKRRPAGASPFSAEAVPPGFSAQNWRAEQDQGGRPPEAGGPGGARRSRWTTAAAFLAGVGAALGGVFGHAHLRPYVDSFAARPAPADERLAQQALAALSQPPAVTSRRADAAVRASPGARGAEASGPIAPLLADYRILGARAATSGDASAEDIFCLLYARGDEPASSLCVARDDRATAKTAIAPAGFSRGGAPDGAPVILWRQAGGRYAIAGPGSERELRDFAARLSAEIAAFAL